MATRKSRFAAVAMSASPSSRLAQRVEHWLDAQERRQDDILELRALPVIEPNPSCGNCSGAK